MYRLKQIPEDFIVDEIPNITIKDKGPYSYYLLEKKDCNTEQAIQVISKLSHIPRKLFGYAGTKDKIAITKQNFSVKGTLKKTSYDKFSIKHIGQGDNPISLGDLKGNKFTITVRNISKKPKLVSKFVNFFGPQRFGRNNFEIGLAILKKKFKTAAGLIDQFSATDYLKKNPTDYVGTIRSVPFKILTIYIASVQSRIWNDVAKEMSKTTEDNLELPLIAFDTEFNNDQIEDLYEQQLIKHGLTQRDFIIRTIPALTPKGNTRQLYADVKDLIIGDLENDGLNNNLKKVMIEFTLGKGCYATVVVDCLINLPSK
jgi:tRNA(Glu) U13 pseudouridine synthase TruD